MLLSPTILGFWGWNGAATEDFFNIIAAIEAIINATAHAITIPAIAPPYNPLELFLYILFPLVVLPGIVLLVA